MLLAGSDEVLGIVTEDVVDQFGASCDRSLQVSHFVFRLPAD
jgi:hypothetical protein